MKSTSGGGVDPWDAKKYLNIWVCTLGGGLLGYAQFPGGPTSTDGVVILNTAFGTNDFRQTNRGKAIAEARLSLPSFLLSQTKTHFFQGYAVPAQRLCELVRQAVTFSRIAMPDKLSPVCVDAN